MWVATSGSIPPGWRVFLLSEGKAGVAAELLLCAVPEVAGKLKAIARAKYFQLLKHMREKQKT